jgi:intracellular septation protein
MAKKSHAETQQKDAFPLSMRLRFLYDLSMFIVFMTLYSVYDPFIATYALLGMSTAKMTAILAAKEPVKLLDWVEFAFLTAFCVATLAFHAAIFIKIKAPLLGVLFLAGMIGYSAYTGHSFMQKLVGKEFHVDLPKDVWRKIDHVIIANLAIKAAIVFTIIFAFPEPVWYFSNFVLPLFDLTMCAIIFMAVEPHLHLPQTRLVDMKDLHPKQHPQLLTRINKHITGIAPTPVLFLKQGYASVRGEERRDGFASEGRIVGADSHQCRGAAPLRPVRSAAQPHSEGASARMQPNSK